jgi:hypothetical protein
VRTGSRPRWTGWRQSESRTGGGPRREMENRIKERQTDLWP